MIDNLVIAYTYYNAPLMLKEHIKHWNGYATKNVKILLIDDGSMLASAEKIIRESPINVTIEVYRIIKDIPRNIWGARNLAYHIASVERQKWVLCLDIDHVLPSRGLDGFNNIGPITTSQYYYLKRYQKEQEGMTPLSRHLDSYLMSPELYWKVGGYDEDLTPYYFNGAAFKFRQELAKHAKGSFLDKPYTLFYPSSLIEDSSPLEQFEKVSYRLSHKADKKPSVLNFEWERVL